MTTQRKIFRPGTIFPELPSGATVTKKELCGRLVISAPAMDRLIAEGKWPTPARLGSSCRWLVDEVDAAFNALRSREPIAGRGPGRRKALAAEAA